MKLLTVLVLLGTLPAFTASADPGDMQQKRITGRVTDNTGAPLPGVNILEKGTINGAISDGEGRYALTVAGPSSVLTFSFIGYTSQDVAVGSLNTVDVVLAEMLSALDEIVVVGYSTQARKSLTGSVSQVGAAELSESAASNPITRLQGKIAGVTILNQHTPGEGCTIRIRGMTTINDANPLYVVDGVPGGSYSPNDVETITILKDAAAQSIYGARAANGVVLITTKGGKKNQKVQMNFNVRQGFSTPGKFYDLLNTQEWADMLWLEAKAISSLVVVPHQLSRITSSRQLQWKAIPVPAWICMTTKSQPRTATTPTLLPGPVPEPTSTVNRQGMQPTRSTPSISLVVLRTQLMHLCWVTPMRKVSSSTPVLTGTASVVT
jgi:TonB-dependent SusC/RagA subfamily outer membrane receptor